MVNNNLIDSDIDIYNLINKEKIRQNLHLELIASENYVSQAVLEAQGSILTNKYAEGYPDNRYYGGCQYVDQIENIAIDRVKRLFNAEYANVQPHSGSQANQAVYFSILNPGDTVLGLQLDQGGHLTHGSPVNLSGKLFNFINYSLNDNEEINYEDVATKAYKYKPKLIIAGASCYSLKIRFDIFADIAKENSAFLMVDMAHYAGLIAANQYPSPIKYADFVTSTTHKTLRGPRGGLILAKGEYEKKLNSSIFPSLQGGPLMHIIAAKAVAFKEALQPEFVDYQIQVRKNADVFVEVLKQRNFRIVSGRTESHLLLIDLTSNNITGNCAQELLDSINITVNKNTIPNDKLSSRITSGIRIGTPAITTRGFKENECKLIANMIADVLINPNDKNLLDKTKQDVIALCNKFPIV